MQDIEHFLLELPLFKNFSQDELKKLIEQSNIKTFSPGEAMIQVGQPGSFLGIILEGEAEASISEPSGEQRRLGLLKPGDVIGEMSLLTGEPTSADVIAVQQSKLLCIPQGIFTGILSAKPDMIKIVAKTITDRLKNRQLDNNEQTLVEKAWRSAPDPYGLKLAVPSPEKILVINCGSSSLKYSYFDTSDETKNTEGIVERIGLSGSSIRASLKKGKVHKELGSVDYSGAFKAVVEQLTDKEEGVIKDLNEITAVGHRVVHGGDKYSSPVLINNEVVEDINKFCNLAPLHNPPNLQAIKESTKLMPNIPQVAVFDTGFHQKMQQHAFMYGIPYDYYEKDGIRRYGFHGISHHYVALQAAGYLKLNFREIKIISCHLGNGASLCAIDHGRSVDTTMGFTPLEGLMMGTRCGDIDPSIIFYLCKEKGISIDEANDILNRQSGLKGLSGISSDLRELESAASNGNQRAMLAIQVFCYRIRKYIGAYVAALGGVDALIFTGGIGEGSAWVRALACQGLTYMGIQLDDMLNRTVSLKRGEVADISAENSKVKILLIPADEERMIARETIRTLGFQKAAQAVMHPEEKSIPLEVSAHHVHLAQKEVDALFGQGHQLTYRSELSQPGQFACEETVNLIGPKGRVDKVRVLGPVRKESQVEISMTEEFKLGIKAPIRPSGDLEGSPGITLEGTKGPCALAKGVICSLRHIHMSPEDALSFNVKDKDIVLVKAEGERKLIFGDVLVRIDPNFRLAMHIDTDEANAASLITGMKGNLLSVQDRR